LSGAKIKPLATTRESGTNHLTPSGVELQQPTMRASAMEVADGPPLRPRITTTAVGVCCAQEEAPKQQESPHHQLKELGYLLRHHDDERNSRADEYLDGETLSGTY
jgi:hypothetical protein